MPDVDALVAELDELHACGDLEWDAYSRLVDAAQELGVQFAMLKSERQQADRRAWQYRTRFERLQVAHATLQSRLDARRGRGTIPVSAAVSRM